MLDLSSEDIEDVRAVVKAFYGERAAKLVKSHNLSEDVLFFLSNLILKTNDCSIAIDLLPQPSDLILGSGASKKILKYLKRVGKGFFENKNYKMCVAAGGYGTAGIFHLKLQGM